MSSPSLRTAAPPPCLPLDIKGSLKEDMRPLDEGGLFGCGRLFDGGRIAEGTISKGRIAEGKRIAEGGLLKGNC
jgi:hypothetical protein